VPEFSRSFNISVMNHYHLVFFIIASSIACLPIKSAALSQNCNPIGIDSSQLRRAEFGREFTIKPGEIVGIFGVLRPQARESGQRGWILLSIDKYRDAPQPDKRIYQITIYNSKKGCQSDPNNVLISRFADYTLNPRSMSAKFERPGLRSYSRRIGIEGIVLELLDLTENGEAKVKLENKQDK
jgi:hypothetical protein